MDDLVRVRAHLPGASRDLLQPISMSRLRPSAMRPSPLMAPRPSRRRPSSAVGVRLRIPTAGLTASRARPSRMSVTLTGSSSTRHLQFALPDRTPPANSLGSATNLKAAPDQSANRLLTGLAGSGSDSDSLSLDVRPDTQLRFRQAHPAGSVNSMMGGGTSPAKTSPRGGINDRRPAATGAEPMNMSPRDAVTGGLRRISPRDGAAVSVSGQLVWANTTPRRTSADAGSTSGSAIWRPETSASPRQAADTGPGNGSRLSTPRRRQQANRAGAPSLQLPEEAGRTTAAARPATDVGSDGGGGIWTANSTASWVRVVG